MENRLKIEGDLTKDQRDSIGGTIRTYQTTTAHPFAEFRPTKPSPVQPKYSVRLIRSNAVPIHAGYSISSHR